MDTDSSLNSSSLLFYPEQIKKAFSVHFCTRSGSYLLCSLFDNHHEILTLPPVDFTPHLKALKEDLIGLSNLSMQLILNRVIENCPFIFRGWNASRKDRVLGPLFKFGAAECVIGTTVLEFRRYFYASLIRLKERGELSFINLIRAIYVSYALCKKRKLDNVKPVLLLSLHQVDHDQIKEFSEIFESYHALVCIRYPVVGFISHLYHTIHEQKELPRAPILHHLNSFFHNSNSKEIPNFLGVKFEDIHQKTEKLMKKLAKIIDIKWSPKLLTSTCDGLTWWWRSESIIKTGTNPNISVYTTGKKANVFDRLRLELLFEPYLKRWGYAYKNRKILSFFKKLLFNFPFKDSIYVLKKNHKGLPLHRKRGILRRELKLIYEAIENSKKNNICDCLDIEADEYNHGD